MSLESFVQVILDKGKSEAEEILAQARAEAERMLSEVRVEGEKAAQDAGERARQAAERKRVQDLARAELETRKIVLAAQKDALDEVYQRALARLGALKENPRMLQALLKANESEWRAGGRVYSNARDAAFVKGLVGKAYAGSVECEGGLVIENADGTRRVDLRYESILRDVWNDSVREVAEILWPSRASKA
ncbi:MAG TPA: V-type ATP synthase subunit E family protein [Thermoplasmata archaeon]|nr:V-type ATP synthase subunit E family protein [Thermoplasmata archaeon]